VRTLTEIPTPLDVYRDVVRPEWIDNNKHMNVGYYLVVFDFATDAWMDFIGLDRAHRQEHHITTFCLEAHLTFAREVREGDPLRFITRLLGWDAKRLHYLHEMYHATEGYLSATNELMSLHVSEATRRAHDAGGAGVPGARGEGTCRVTTVAACGTHHRPPREVDDPIVGAVAAGHPVRICGADPTWQRSPHAGGVSGPVRTGVSPRRRPGALWWPRGPAAPPSARARRGESRSPSGSARGACTRRARRSPPAGLGRADHP
jgi:acyl-CoA thioester hydrolase